MRVAHFYHAFVDGGAWDRAVTEHVQALDAAGVPRPIHIGLVGGLERRLKACGYLGDHLIAAEADAGWEQATLAAVREYAQSHIGDAVLYAHTKGASAPTPFNHRWRQSMQRHVVEDWRGCLSKLLEGRYDAVGCHWLTHADFPQNAGGMADGFFGGNYWMATCGYLAGLPPCSHDTRWDAESWIGLGEPRVFDLLEGWPSEQAFMRGGLR